MEEKKTFFDLVNDIHHALKPLGIEITGFSGSLHSGFNLTLRVPSYEPYYERIPEKPDHSPMM